MSRPTATVCVDSLHTGITQCPLRDSNPGPSGHESNTLPFGNHATLGDAWQSAWTQFSVSNEMSKTTNNLHNINELFELTFPRQLTTLGEITIVTKKPSVSPSICDKGELCLKKCKICLVCTEAEYEGGVKISIGNIFDPLGQP